MIVPIDVKAIYLADLNNRESVTSIECVSASRKTIPPIIIIKGDVLLKKYFENNIDDDAVLRVSSTSITNDQLTFN